MDGGVVGEMRRGIGDASIENREVERYLEQECLLSIYDLVD